MSNIEVNHHIINIEEYQNLLISWGKDNFRQYPWRKTSDPYIILIAEILLHRTQAKQVVPIFEKFVKRFPDIYSLSNARLDEIQTLLSPLGLHWRAPLIKKMCEAITSTYNNRIPESKSQLLSLPGVSHYIAGAVRCFAWNYPEPLADTNTIRVIGRLFCLEIKDSSRRSRLFNETLSTLVPIDLGRPYNFSLLDLADKLCTKKRPPDCRHCPINGICCFGLNRELV